MDFLKVLVKTGKVLWWDSRDGNGIIVDADGNEYYLDCSVLEQRSRHIIKQGLIVSFETNSAIKDTLCAYKITIPSESTQDGRKIE
jgi:cold shock CspA family protein